MKNDTVPTQVELDAWTQQTLDWFRETGKKRISKALKADLAERGAKWCSTCQRVNLLDDFLKDASRADGLDSRCRDCQNNRNRERYHNDDLFREQQREYQRTRYRTNELHRLRHQLYDGLRRAEEAGGVVEDFDAADLLAWWEQQGIPADRDYFTDEPLDPATRSVDHLWPLSKGGPHARWAVVPVTIGTNLAKQTMSPTEFRDRLRSEGIEPADRPDPAPFLSEAACFGAL